METFGGQLNERRERLGMSQSQLAEALGVATLTISRWECGKRTPRMPAAVLALVHTLKPLPRGERRFGKSGRPPQK